MNAGKNALVTGGIRGIGLEIVKILLRTDIEKLCVADLNQHNITFEMLAHDFPNTNIMFQKCDVSIKDHIDKCYKETMKKFKHLDIVINNAAVLDDTKCEQTLLTNLCGVINSSLVGMNYMSKENGGHGGYIINISGTEGLGPNFYLPIYAASKWGVTGFTRCMGYNNYYYEKTGVKFMGICPGLTLTNLNDSLKDKFFITELKQLYDHDVIGKVDFQDITTASVGVLQAIKADRNGSVFICDKDKIEEVKLEEFTQEFMSKDKA